MYKWSELSLSQKGIRVLSMGVGFTMGCMTGGAVNCALANKGFNTLVSNGMGVATTALHTKLFKILGDVIIDADKEI